MEEQYFRKILEKKINGISTPEEDNLLEQFEQTMLEKNKASVFSNDNHRNRINEDLIFQINTHIKNKKKPKKRVLFLNIAASIVILFSIGLSYIYLNSNIKIVLENTSSEPKQFILSDGSKITLNRDSKLIQDKEFNSDNRFVELEGEAFFEIRKNKSIPFIIKTKSIFTKVVGTKFNINTTENFIKVSVNEGHVKVYDNKDTLDATHNQQIAYNFKSKKLIENSVNSELCNLWAKDEFELNTISVEELSKVFESVYNYKIVFKNDKIKNKKISITFHRNDKISTILDKINLINEFKLTKKQEHVIEAQ